MGCFKRVWKVNDCQLGGLIPKLDHPQSTKPPPQAIFVSLPLLVEPLEDVRELVQWHFVDPDLNMSDGKNKTKRNSR